MISYHVVRVNWIADVIFVVAAAVFAYGVVTIPQAMTCWMITATQSANSVKPNSMTHAHC